MPGDEGDLDRVEAAIAEAAETGPLTPDAVLAAVSVAGVTLTPCKAYHVRKALTRVTVPSPEVLHRTTNTLTVRVHGYTERDEVPTRHLELRVNGSIFNVGSPASEGTCVEFVVRNLEPGASVTLQSRARTGDVLIDATLPWTNTTSVRVQLPPNQPRAPEVAPGAAAGSLVVRMHNPGAVSDPPGVRLEVGFGLKGVLTESVLVAISDPLAAYVDHILEGLRCGKEYSIRYRVLVGDTAIDALAAWSPVTLEYTCTRFEAEQQQRLVSAVVGWRHDGGVAYHCTMLHRIVFSVQDRWGQQLRETCSELASLKLGHSGSVSATSGTARARRLFAGCPLCF
jgi:hypothetical protein